MNPPQSGLETPSSSTTATVESLGDDKMATTDATGIVQKEEITQKGKSSDVPKEEEDDPKKRRGWPSRPPFSKNPEKNSTSKDQLADRIYWGELTWKQKIAWRRAFLREYLAETKSCLPHVRKLFLMIYRISPWRAIVVFALNVVSGLLPALTLQTRGNFIIMAWISVVILAD